FSARGAIARVQAHLNWFDRAYGGLLGQVATDGTLGPATKAHVKRSLYFLGSPDVKIAWATLPFSVQRFIDCRHHPTLVGNPIWIARGIRRRRRPAAQHISRAGVDFISAFEGFSPTWYDDGTGT